MQTVLPQLLEGQAARTQTHPWHQVPARFQAGLLSNPTTVKSQQKHKTGRPFQGIFGFRFLNTRKKFAAVEPVCQQ